MGQQILLTIVCLVTGLFSIAFARIAIRDLTKFKRVKGNDFVYAIGYAVASVMCAYQATH